MEMITSNHENNAFEYYPPLHRIRSYANRRYAEKITLHKAAEIACLEQKYFSTYFHQKTGVCFSHWLAELRVKKAMACIETSNASITETAYKVGFRNLRTFERAFKRHTGITPRQFKKISRPD